MSTGNPQPQPTGVLQENHEKLKRLFVDVGFGDYPVVNCRNWQFRENETYLGLELERSKTYSLFSTSGMEKIEKLSEKYKNNPNIQFKKVEGDQDEFHFPVPDGVASEVHIANVFGIPGAVDSHNLQLLLEESIRILRQGGTLSVLETLTPNYSKETFEGILKLYPLKITLSISPHSSEWQSSVAEYQDYANGRDWDPKKGQNDSYYLIKAEKQPIVEIPAK